MTLRRATSWILSACYLVAVIGVFFHAHAPHFSWTDELSDQHHADSACSICSNVVHSDAIGFSVASSDSHTDLPPVPRDIAAVTVRLIDARSTFRNAPKTSPPAAI